MASNNYNASATIAHKYSPLITWGCQLETRGSKSEFPTWQIQEGLRWLLNWWLPWPSHSSWWQVLICKEGFEVWRWWEQWIAFVYLKLCEAQREIRQQKEQLRSLSESAQARETFWLLTYSEAADCRMNRCLAFIKWTSPNWNQWNEDIMRHLTSKFDGVICESPMSVYNLKAIPIYR